MRCWRMLAVSKGQGCLPWIAQAEMPEKCLIASLLLITGLSLSLYLPHMCMRTHTKRKIYIYGHCDWKKGSLAWFWKTSMVNPLLMGLTCILWIRTKKLVTFYVLKYCSMFVTELVKHLSPPSWLRLYLEHQHWKADYKSDSARFSWQWRNKSLVEALFKLQCGTFIRVFVELLQ